MIIAVSLICLISIKSEVKYSLVSTHLALLKAAMSSAVFCRKWLLPALFSSEPCPGTARSEVCIVGRQILVVSTGITFSQAMGGN